MIKVLVFTTYLLSSLSAVAANDKLFADQLFGITVKADFAAYSKLIHPTCKLTSTTEKAFKLRSNLLSKLEKGVRVDAISMEQYRQIKEKQGYPFVDNYSVEPSFYAIVWKSVDARIDLNPVVKNGDKYFILEGSCISAVKK